MAKISELSAGQGNVDVEGTVKEIGEIKSFNKFGKELKVANAILEDDSGNIKLTLWNDETTKYKDGDKVKITNGYVNEFQGEPQLTAGKFGKIEVVGEGGEAEPTEEAKETPAEEDKAEEEVSEAVEEETSDEAPAEETPAEDKAEESTDEAEKTEDSE